jgi:hypothetical protein
VPPRRTVDDYRVTLVLRLRCTIRPLRPEPARHSATSKTSRETWRSETCRCQPRGRLKEMDDVGRSRNADKGHKADQPAVSLQRVQGIRNRRAPPRADRAAPPSPTARAPAGGSNLLDGREPIAAARTVVVISDHADDAAGLAPTFGREPVDVRATLGATADRP